MDSKKILQGYIDEFEEFQKEQGEIQRLKDEQIKAYENKIDCVTTSIGDAIAQQSKFGSSYGQKRRMVGYRSPSRRAPRARGMPRRRRSPMMY